MSLEWIQEIYKSHSLKFRTSLDQRKTIVLDRRRSARNSIMMQKRNIREEALTPITSPAVSATKTPKSKKKQPTQKKVNKVVEPQQEKKGSRLERLRQWQAEKLKRLEREKSKQKPMFKVRRLSNSLYDIDKAYNEIKGKPITVNKTFKENEYKFVPSSAYKFKAPSNIKPINFTYFNKTAKPKTLQRETVAVARVTRSQTAGPSSARQKLNFKTEANKKKSKNSDKSVTFTEDSAVRLTKGAFHIKRKATPLKPSLAENIRNRSLFSPGSLEEPKPLPQTPVAGNNGIDTASCSPKSTGKENSRRKPKKRISTKIASAKHLNSSLSPEYPITNSDSTSEIYLSASDSPKTPVVSNADSDVVYVSPYVTKSRGKDNARKEFQRRISKGGSDHDKSTSPKAAAAYFRMMLSNQIDRLKSVCNEWATFKEYEQPPEEACDMINVAIGQTELLLNKKFQQFKDLICRSENGDAVQPVTCYDLHGYWDLIMIQVENIDKRFDNLESLKKNNWEEILPLPEKTKRKKVAKKGGKKAAASSSTLRAAILEARKRKVTEAIPAEAELVNTSREAKRYSLRNAFVNDTNRLTNSPGLTMMKVTQVAKSVDKAKHTPDTSNIPKNTPKSILKSNSCKAPSYRKSKVVLFKDSVSDGEAGNDRNTINVFSSSICTPRRSARLSGKFKPRL